MTMTINMALKAQRGSALIVSLVMLLLISLIGVGSMQGTILQERMASNLQDRNIAFQASERALRVGENAVAANPLSVQTNDRLADPESWGGGGTDTVTVNATDDQLSADPEYHTGWVSVFCPSVQSGAPCFDRFSVTSRGQGGTDTSIVILQSMFMPQPR
jgi:type IV pilus assembly protein PilX